LDQGLDEAGACVQDTLPRVLCILARGLVWAEDSGHGQKGHLKIALSTESGCVSAHFGRFSIYTLVEIENRKVNKSWT
jgi:hypothetical protein